jgi:hypothetical protein
LLLGRRRSRAGTPVASVGRFGALSEVSWSQAGPPSDSGEHVRADLFAVVKSKDVIRPIGSCQYSMRCSGLALDRPTDAEQSRQDQASLARRPTTHAGTAKSSSSSGTVSPCSIRSAMTRRASVSALATASALLSPYAITPGKSGISAIHRPSDSRSISIFMMAIYPHAPVFSIISMAQHGSPSAGTPVAIMNRFSLSVYCWEELSIGPIK